MTFDTVDAVVAWPKVPYHNRLKAYPEFLQAKREFYLRYDIELDRQDFGYPKPIGPDWPGLPNNIDAALVWPVARIDGKRRAYFFSGRQVNTRWNIDDNVVDPNYPKPIVGNWNNWPTHWTRVDAALEWDDERVYLFHRGGVTLPL